MTGNNYLISIIMPAFNVEKYIKDSIISVINQSYKNLELLIFDDCSSDNTIIEIKKFDDTRIKLFQGNMNLGAAKARNYLLSKAKGDFIAFLDSDDICLKHRFKHCISYFENNPKIELLGAKTILIDEKSNRYNFVKSFETFNYRDVEADLFFNNTFSLSTVIFRRSILKYMIFDERYEPAEDYELFSRISSLVKMENINKSLVKYRISPNSLSFTKKDKLNGVFNFISERSFKKLNIDVTSERLSIHNDFLNSGHYDASQLDDSVLFYSLIIKKNTEFHTFNEESLLKAIRKNWFLKSMHSSKKNGILSLFYYWTRFPFHNYTVLKDSIYILAYIIKNHIRNKIKYFIY
jgi:glycosyltransferase involved in cell wall biosynthesis